MFSNNMYKELEQLKARVGWLDHLDTEEGRRMHANEALLVEIEQLKAENEKLKAYAPDPFDDSLPTYAQLVKDLHETESELGSVRDMLLDVAHSGVEIELRQYTTVQINRTMWDKIQEWAKDKETT